jgi:predicted anti-sigma-YlaC factor YlaD
MNCDEIREKLPDVAAGLIQATPDETEHLAGCHDCAGKLAEFAQTMALLDEWQSPEPSPYFDTRLQARLREEMAKPQRGWLHWFRHPVLAAALTLAIGLGVGLFFAHSSGIYRPDGTPVANMDSGPGTAVSDLKTLDDNNEIYSDSDLLDDLQVQQDVKANP